MMARLFNSGNSKTVTMMDTVSRSVVPLYHNKTFQSQNCSCFLKNIKLFFFR